MALLQKDGSIRHELAMYRPRPEFIQPLKHIERRAVEQALILCEGNKVQATRHLGISRATLYRWLRQFKLESEDFLIEKATGGVGFKA